MVVGRVEGIAAGIPTKGTNAWGFKTSSSSENVTVSAAQQAYRAIDEGGQIIANGKSASANEGDVISLTFGVTVDTTIAAGTYQDEVVLTATTK